MTPKTSNSSSQRTKTKLNAATRGGGFIKMIRRSGGGDIPSLSYTTNKETSVEEAITSDYTHDGSNPPYRIITNWSIKDKNDKVIELPLNPGGKMGKKTYLCGELVPVPASQNSERITVRLPFLVRWTFDKSDFYRGYWMGTQKAWYWLKKPSEEQEKKHFRHRAICGVLSNIIDMMPQQDVLDIYSGCDPTFLYETAKEKAYVPYDLNLLKLERDVIKRELRNKDGAGIMRLKTNCTFLKKLTDPEEKEKLKEEYEGGLYKESAEEAEKRSNRKPWGERVLDNEGAWINPYVSINQLLKMELEERSNSDHRTQCEDSVCEFQSTQCEDSVCESQSTPRFNFGFGETKNTVSPEDLTDFGNYIDEDTSDFCSDNFSINLNPSLPKNTNRRKHPNESIDQSRTRRSVCNDDQKTVDDEKKKLLTIYKSLRSDIDKKRTEFSEREEKFKQRKIKMESDEEGFKKAGKHIAMAQKLQDHYHRNFKEESNSDRCVFMCDFVEDNEGITHLAHKICGQLVQTTKYESSTLSSYLSQIGFELFGWGSSSVYMRKTNQEK